MRLLLSLALVSLSLLATAIATPASPHLRLSHRRRHHDDAHEKQAPAKNEVIAAPSDCPLNSTVNVVFHTYTATGGVGIASADWITDFLNWWQSVDSSIEYMPLTEQQIRACNFNDYPNLRLFVNPGGWATDQLLAYGSVGAQNIVDFITSTTSHVYVGICAGGYLAAHDYTWESQYMPPSYFTETVGSPAPLNLFPYTVEGSIVDVGDDEYGDYESGYAIRYRMVNVTSVVDYFVDRKAEEQDTNTVYQMLYYGGSTFGWNGLPDYTQTYFNCTHDGDADVDDLNCEVLRKSKLSETDALVKPILYYTDFYGYKSVNFPAMWQYSSNILIGSIHPAADQSVCDVDCPASGTLTDDQILANRQFFASQVNRLLGNTFKVPKMADVSKTQRLKASPHTAYPTLACASSSTLFCDDFNVPPSLSVYPGMFQWQRNQTSYYDPRPWNTTFTGTMLSSSPDYYGTGVDGASDGWAVNIPYVASSSSRTREAIANTFPHSYAQNAGHTPKLAATPVQYVQEYPASIISQAITFTSGSSITISYYFKGTTLQDGLFSLSYSCDGYASYTLLRSQAIDTFDWTKESFTLSPSNCGTSSNPFQIAFSCYAGQRATTAQFCGIDQVIVA